MSLKARIERLERECFPGKKTIYLFEAMFVSRMHKKYGENLESAPDFLRSECKRLDEILRLAFAAHAAKTGKEKEAASIKAKPAI